MFQKKVKDKLSQYADPTGEFSNRQFKLAEWYVVNKLRLKKIGIGALIVWCALTIGYSFGYWGYYFSTGYFKDKDMMARQTIEIENYDNLKHFYAPRNLNIQNTEVYQSISPENYDFVADAANPNERWLATVEYKFVFNGGETPLARAVILPGVKEPLAFFGFKSAGYPSGAKLEIKEINWRHLDRHLYPDARSFMAERSMWGIDNFKFTPISRLAGTLSNRIEFDITNYSAYNFWRANFFVELIGYSGRVGLVYLPVEKFISQETRHIDIRSFLDNQEVSDIVAHPVTNVFEQSEFMGAGDVL